jgi:hypothetical protein
MVKIVSVDIICQMVPLALLCYYPVRGYAKNTQNIFCSFNNTS